MSKCEQCIVREFSALKALHKEELLHLADCKTSSTVRKGETIFEEGDTVNGVYCIKDGVCKLTKLSPNGKDQIVKLVKKGELLGQRSMVSQEPANLSAVALEDMQVCFIPKQEILGLFDSNSKFSVSLMKTICGDLKEADDFMVAMTQQTVKERLAHMLVHLADTFGMYSDGSLRIQLSREDIASLIGTATESCIRLLSDFNKNGLITIAGKKIIISDRGGLLRLGR